MVMFNFQISQRYKQVGIEMLDYEFVKHLCCKYIQMFMKF